MAKKLQLKIMIPGIIALVLTIVAFCMLFVKSIGIQSIVDGKTYGDVLTFKAKDIAFGYSQHMGNISVQVINKSIILALAFILPLVASILVIAFNGKTMLDKVLGTYLPMIIYLFATIVVFCIVPIFKSSYAVEISDWSAIKFTLQIGTIIAAIMNILAILVTFGKEKIVSFLK